jgi:TolB-like protein/DNA-binding winged helix-turn-helix (wHTH) protein/rhodanese-related sulfurtransferase
MDAGPNYRFGQYELDAASGMLLADGQPRALNPRAFKLLLLLLNKHGQLVTKDEIMEQVWEGLFVEENNLAVQISALRKALGDGPNGQPFIVNVSGQGYRFVAAVTRPGAEEPAAAPHRRDVPRPVRRLLAGAFAVAAIGLAALVWHYWGDDKAPPRLSIAVLPFRNLSNDPEQTYLADAVSDDLTTELAHLPGSFVIARESADTYRDRVVTAQQVGKELGVRYMLEGSVRPVADRLLINAQLIDTGSGAHLWAERFDTDRVQLDEAQASIVHHIAGALSFNLLQIEGQRSALDRPKDPDALDLFFRARSILDRDRSLKGLDAAQPLLEKAIAQRPDFIDALNTLSWLLLRRGSEFDDPKQAVDWAEASALTSRALAIDPKSPSALVNKGQSLQLDGKCREAIASFQLALSIAPNDIPARDGIGLCGDILGHPEQMVAAMREAIALDPQDPGNADRFGHLGMAFLLLDRPQDAIEWLLKAEAGRSEPVERFERGLIEAYALTGRSPEAREKFARYDKLWPRRTVWRESCYASKAVSTLPGFQHALSGLAAAGMPAFENEAANENVPPTTEFQLADFYSPTPAYAPYAKTATTDELSRMLSSSPSPVILDVGCAKAAIPGAILAYWADDGLQINDGIQTRLTKALEVPTGGDFARAVVVVGTGIYGWGAYNVTLRLNALGYRNVYWYRGGEEAWAAAGLPAEDRRDP